MLAECEHNMSVNPQLLDLMLLQKEVDNMDINYQDINKAKAKLYNYLNRN